MVDLVAALSDRPEFGAASIEALLALAERVGPTAAPGAIELETPAGPRWLEASDVDGVAARYPDLALALLKARDGRAYAA